MENGNRNEPIGEPRDEGDAGLVGRVTNQTRETLERARDGLAAGASGVMDLTRTVTDETRERAGRVVEFVRESETDTELKETVSGTTERSLHRAGDALAGAAPTIGRGAEFAAEKVGQALHAVARPLAVILGTVAGTLGGWWTRAREERLDLPEAEEQACRAHFTSISVAPADMSYERARTGYALGYVASRHPEYLGRRFEEIEPELRRGFGEEHAADYDALREFTRFGYGRGSGEGR